MKHVFAMVACTIFFPALHAAQPAGAATGWRELFDGRSTAGWRNFRAEGLSTGWQVIGGALTLVEPGKGGDIITAEQFANFELTLEWKIAKGGNSGIFYGVSEDAAAVYHTGPEYQLLDNAHASEPPVEQAASLFALYAPSQDVSRPAGEFNQTRLVVDHGHVEHWLNGVKVLEYSLRSPDFAARAAASKFASMPGFARHESGYIALQDHGDAVAFRNIKIRSLD